MGIGVLVIALFSGGITTVSFSSLIDSVPAPFAPHSDITTEPQAARQAHEERLAVASLILATRGLVENVAAASRLTTPVSEPMLGWITHYGARFDGRKVGCSKLGYYSTADPTIVAVNPTLYEYLPCGTLLELCGPAGCILAARKDSCPGCRDNGFDLSEAAFQRVCGEIADGVCEAIVHVVQLCPPQEPGSSRAAPTPIDWAMPSELFLAPANLAALQYNPPAVALPPLTEGLTQAAPCLLD